MDDFIPDSQFTPDSERKVASDSDFIPDSKFQSDEDKYGTLGQQAITGLEGAASAASFGLSTGLERKLGVKAEDIRARREVNPGSHMLGQAAGLVGSAFIPGLGEANAAKVLTGGGKLAARAVGLGAAEGLGAKVAQGAITAAAENALFQGGDEISKMLSSDPHQSVETALANVGLSSLFGGAVGGVLGGAPKLWKATVGDKASQFIDDFKGRMGEHLTNPDPAGALAKELTDLYHGTKAVADEVYGASGIKAQEIKKLMPDMSEKISGQVQEINEKIGKTLVDLKDDPYLGQLKDAVEAYQSKITEPGVGSGEVFNATQELKQQLQEWGKYNKNFSPLGERRFRDAAKKLAFDIRNSLEDSKVWGKAAERQKSINEAFSEYLPALKNFESKFTTELAGERVIDPGKVATFVNQAGKMNGAVKREMLGNFIEAAEKYKKVIGESHHTLGLESPIESGSLAVAKSALQELSGGAKLADALVKRGLAKTSGEVAGAGTGAILGSAVGAPGIGAIIGQHALGPFFSSIFPAIAKPILESKASSTALRGATEYGLSVIKGEALITKGARSIFKSTREVLPSKATEVSEKDRERLSEQIAAIEKDPSKLLTADVDAAHYMPAHAIAMSETASRVVNYLSSIRPKGVKLAPLDDEIEPSKEEVDNFKEALTIAEKPLSILHKVKSNTLLPQDIKNLVSMYPEVYKKLSQSITNQMIEVASEKEEIPYTLKQSLSMFLGQPLDSTLTPIGIQAAQMSAIVSRPQPQQSQGAPKKNTSKLAKSADQYRSPNESSLLRKNQV